MSSGSNGSEARWAGVYRVFIGLENVNPDNLLAAKKRQNKITEYRKMLLAWKAEGVMTIAGYILGFPADTPETIRRDIAILQHELPVDIVEFFCLTPLPGSEDHQVLWKKGGEMDPDLNIYDIEHVCTPHPRMSKAEWEGIYREAWPLYYSPEHNKTLLRRAIATGVPISSLIKLLVTFGTSVPLENMHPLQTGVLRLMRPSERRPGLPRENAFAFWPRFIWQTLRKNVIIVSRIAGLAVTAWMLGRQPGAREYIDTALTPVGEDGDASMDLFTKTSGAAAAMAHLKKVAELVDAGRTAA